MKTEIETTLKQFAPGTRVLCDLKGAGIERDVLLIVNNAAGHLDAAIGFNGLVPVIRLKDGVLIMKRADTPAILAPV